MKIGLLTHDMDPKTGWGRFASELANGIEKMGHEVIVLKEQDDGCEGYAVLSRKAGLLVSALRTAVRLRKCDVIHALDGHPYGTIAAIANIFIRKKLIITAQGTYAVAPLYRWLTGAVLRWAYRQADTVTAISEYTKKELAEGEVSRDITVIHHGIDISKIGEARAQSGENFILSVGAMKERKGYHVSIPAFLNIAPRFPGLRYIIVAEPPTGWYAQELKPYLHSEYSDRILISGAVSDERLAELYRAAKLFVLASTSTQEHHFEGFGLVFLEAAAHGLPVIGTSGSGIEDALKDRYNGILIPQNNVEKTAEAMAQILSDSELSQRLGGNGYTWARSHSLNGVVQQYLAEYRSAVIKHSKNEEHPARG